MSSFTERRAETNSYVDDLIAKFNAQKVQGNPTVCIDLPDYPSDDLMDRVINELNARRYHAEPVEFTATSGRAGCIWITKR